MTEKTKRDQSTTILLIFVGVGTAIVLLIIGLVSLSRSSNNTGHDHAAGESDFTGITLVNPPQDVPDFTLTNQDGKPTRLSDLRGKPTLIFFGFTHCPDVCPMTLSEFLRLNEAVGPDKVNFVFISVDGARDTPAVMKQRLANSRTPFVIGLTGDVQDVLKYGAPFNLVAESEPKDAAGEYDIAHTSAVFVLNASGQWVAKYEYLTPLDTMIADLKTRL